MIALLRLCAFILCLMPFAAHAANLDFDAFRRIPVQDEGRVKPVDSFARISLKKLSGREKLLDMDAAQWLAETIFDPAAGVTRPVFKIENAYVRHRFGLLEKKDFLYSYTDILPGLKKTTPDAGSLLQRPQSNLSRDEKALLTLHDNAVFYTSLMRSLSLLLPLNVSLPEKYTGQFRGELSYLDLRRLDQVLSKDLSVILKKKGEDISRYTADEKKTALLSFQLQTILNSAKGNDVFRIVPPQWADDGETFSTPWQVIEKGEGSPATAKLFNTWKQMGDAYLANDAANWYAATTQARSLSANAARDHLFDAEILQNKYPPFRISLLFYTLAFAASCLYVSMGGGVMYRVAWGAAIIGALIHLAGIGLRVLLLDRPPVGTLYESMLFVSLTIVGIALILEHFQRNCVGILMGAMAAALTLLMSFGFVGEGDSMTMLGAVLNTNFWLATHVLCITMGYGWCLLTAVLAHLALLAKPLRLKFDIKDASLHLLSVFALLFTCVGTILGGIWADQSWGRFWGWDPKENGALLIVLWLVWLLHGKLGGQLSRPAFMSGLAFMTVIVGISWIGVNLLGVGLHSYGFADGYFYGLGIFIIAETMLIGALWHLNKKP